MSLWAAAGFSRGRWRLRAARPTGLFDHGYRAIPGSESLPERWEVSEVIKTETMTSLRRIHDPETQRRLQLWSAFSPLDHNPRSAQRDFQHFSRTSQRTETESLRGRRDWEFCFISVYVPFFLQLCLKHVISGVFSLVTLTLVTVKWQNK